MNTYHALLPAPDTTPNYATAKQFVEFVGSAAGQQIIRDYGKEAYFADLGRWLNGSYAIPGEEPETGTETEPGEPRPLHH